ncbi:MAG: fatty acid--CoA ligase family protein [Bryobacteraceae bacterium]|jgi:acyl-CoA synthetase (AMP-forming)/AMP-acid ligase II
MSGVGWLLERMRETPGNQAVIADGSGMRYGALLDRVSFWKEWLRSKQLGSGDVIALNADYSPDGIAILLALLDALAIVLLLPPTISAETAESYRIAEAKAAIQINGNGTAREVMFGSVVSHPLLRALADKSSPGLILMSSGSTGKPKASLHDAGRFLEKFQRPRAALRAVAVPPMDHVAGLDTLMYCLSSSAAVVCIQDREPATVCRAIESQKVQLLPASAAFLNLLLMSGAYRSHDLSSLQLVAYGSDVMPQPTLDRLKEILPNTAFVQKYGTTELGSPRTRTREDGSLWVKIDDEGYETKIVDGTLWIRARSAMLGYLNARDPFDEEGWINTEDGVEADGEYVRFLGRTSDLINVGGQKIYPTEVENVLMHMDNVSDVLVFGSPNAIMGHVVGARFRLINDERYGDFKRRVRTFCKERLVSYKVPVVIEVTYSPLISSRQKKIRSSTVFDAHA